MEAANYLICFENYIVNHQWLKQFLELNPEYYIQKQKLLAVEQKYSHDVNNMSNYFKKIEWVMREKRITELNLLNINETSFQNSCEKAQLIVTIDVNKLFQMIDPENRNYIISVKYIDSADEIIPPILLISGVGILYKWYRQNDLDGNVVISTIETSYTNNNTG